MRKEEDAKTGEKERKTKIMLWSDKITKTRKEFLDYMEKFNVIELI